MRRCLYINLYNVSLLCNNLYVRQANLKVILELTGSQCSSDRRAEAGCCERLGKTMQATEVCTRVIFLMLMEPWIRVATFNIWNSLPNNVVQASSIDTFKHKLDRFCCKQDIKYDYTAEYNGARRSSQFYT